MPNTNTQIPSTCWECSTHCGSLLTIEHERVVDIKPNSYHPSSRGAFCVKGIKALTEQTYHRNRLLYPLKRDGERGSGSWKRIPWTEALDIIVNQFLKIKEKYGGPALVGAVSNAHFSRGVSVALLMRAFGSPNWMMNQDLCGGCRGISDKVTGLSINNGEDLDKTKCALIVGRNPAAADPAQWLALKRAKKIGAKIVVIDPVRTATAKISDLWLQPKPGTDSALAMAIINWLITNQRYDKKFVESWTFGFESLAKRAANYPIQRVSEITGVLEDDIRKAAELYANGPSCFVSGHGIDAFTSGVQTFRAFHCLVAISGNLDRPGGNRRVKKPSGFTNYIEVLHKPEFRLPKEVEEKTIGADRFPLWAGPNGWQTSCHNPSVVEAMLTGSPYPIRGLYVSGVNIVVTYPNTPRTIAAINSLDFVVGAGHMMNPTLALCDIVLPKTTGLEEQEVSLEPGGPCLSVIQPAHDPLGETKSDFDIAQSFVERLEAKGHSEARRIFPWRSKNIFDHYLLGDGPISIKELKKKGFAEYDYENGDFDENSFKTTSKRVELYSQTLKQIGLDPLPGYEPVTRESVPSALKKLYPLVLLTGAREKAYHHSRFREQTWAKKLSPDPWIEINPETAREFGVNDKDWIELELLGGPGACNLRARVTTDIAAGVLRTGMGWWTPDASEFGFGALKININAALSYGPPWDPATGSPDTRGLLCRIRRVKTSSGGLKITEE